MDELKNTEPKYLEATMSIEQLRNNVTPFINAQGYLENCPIGLEAEIYLQFRENPKNVYEFKRSLGLSAVNNFTGLSRRVEKYFKKFSSKPKPVGKEIPQKEPAFIPVKINKDVPKAVSLGSKFKTSKCELKTPDGFVFSCDDLDHLKNIYQSLQS